MRRLDGRTPRLGTWDILGFATIRDEALRLPWFLDYHRRAGVARFFIVDNGSRDGSTEYLLAQSDVTVYYTEEPYSDSQCGLRWINELLDRYAADRWCLTLDADELLVYPGCETVDLGVLTSYLDSVGADALETMLLDMYSEKPIRDAVYSAGEPFLDTCPFFDANHYSFAKESAVAARGGPRDRAFWQGRNRPHLAPYLRKVPLVKWRPGRVYEASTHQISGIEPAELTGALLHFKFFSDFPGRAALEAERKEHFAGARQYVTYSEVLSEEPELSLFGECSVRYQDSLQLTSLGLLGMPSSYRTLLSLMSDSAGGGNQSLVRR